MGELDADRLQKTGDDLVNTVQSNREIRPHEENRETGAKARRDHSEVQSLAICVCR